MPVFRQERKILAFCTFTILPGTKFELSMEGLGLIILSTFKADWNLVFVKPDLGFPGFQRRLSS